MPPRFLLPVLLLVVAGMASPSGAVAQAAQLDPARMPRAAKVDARFLSYNVEMVEVMGGRFWKPYGAAEGDPKDPYQYRPPIDLANARLRNLAAALGPAYVRVSGTWANKVYFHDADSPPPAKAPEGFDGVLTRESLSMRIAWPAAPAVAVLVVNAERQRAYIVSSPVKANVYALGASELQSEQVRLNGKDLVLGPSDELPALAPAEETDGAVPVAPANIAFIAYPGADNVACR